MDKEKQYIMKNCERCDKLVNQNKEFSANLNELKREKPNISGQMLPKYIIT